MRILTGLQPSGKPHVGNYFGAMKPAVELQAEGEGFYFIADYHAMTSGRDAAALRVVVTVAGPANASLVLEGYRTRHAPNSAN